MKKLKPIIRIAGSKYKLINKIFAKFDFPENQEFAFFEPFAGSMIVGANVKYQFPKSTITLLSDLNSFFDENNKLNKEELIKNQISYSGFGNTTKAAIKQFETKEKNGYWDLVKKWETDILSKSNLYLLGKDFESWKEFLMLINLMNEDIAYMIFSLFTPFYVYIDPPYFGEKYTKLYKNKVNHEELAKILNQKFLNSQMRVLISYNDCSEIRELYKDWKIEEVPITYTLTSNKNIKRTNELFITNF